MVPLRLCADVKEGRLKLRAGDFPSFLYPEDEFDPDNLDKGLLKSPFLLAVFIKTIFHNH